MTDTTNTPTTGSPHPNEEMLQLYWKATTAGDIETMKTLLHDDAVYHYPGQHFLSGDYHGKDEVAALYTRLAGLAVRGGMFEGHVKALAFGGEFSIIVLTYKLNLLRGRSLPGRACGMMRIIDGKVKEYWLFEWDQSMVNDVFWSSAPQAFFKQGDYVQLLRRMPRSALALARTVGRLFGSYRAPV